MFNLVLFSGIKSMKQVDPRTIHPCVRKFFTFDSSPFEDSKAASEGQVNKI